MSNNSSSRSSGIGFLGMLQVAFIVLKVLDMITWSWWLVLIPIWISILFLIVSILISLFFVFK